MARKIFPQEMTYQRFRSLSPETQDEILAEALGVPTHLVHPVLRHTLDDASYTQLAEELGLKDRAGSHYRVNRGLDLMSKRVDEQIDRRRKSQTLNSQGLLPLLVIIVLGFIIFIHWSAEHLSDLVDWLRRGGRQTEEQKKAIERFNRRRGRAL